MDGVRDAIKKNSRYQGFSLEDWIRQLGYCWWLKSGSCTYWGWLLKSNEIPWNHKVLYTLGGITIATESDFSGYSFFPCGSVSWWVPTSCKSGLWSPINGNKWPWKKIGNWGYTPTRWWFRIFCIFTLRGIIQFDEHIFQAETTK